MTTLVTGAAGFIGSSVVRGLLAEGRQVRCLIEPGGAHQNLDGLDLEIVYGDIRSRDDLRAAMKGIRVVYHLAAVYRLWLPDPTLLYEVNVEGSKNLLFAAMDSAIEKLVFTSSIAAVGKPPPGSLANESTCFNTWSESDHYMRSKWLSERDALRFAAEGLPLVVVNPAFPFGERDAVPTPTGRYIVKALRGELPGYLAGGFNVVDVDDVAQGHLLAEKRGRIGQRYILGNHNLSYREFYEALAEVAGIEPLRHQIPSPLVWAGAYLVEKIAERSGRPPELTYKAARCASRQLYFDSSKAIGELGMPQTDLHKTLAKSVAWFREHGYA